MPVVNTECLQNQNAQPLTYHQEVTNWVETEFASADLGDSRLDTRLQLILKSFSHLPNASIPEASDTWGEAKGTYRFINNKKVLEQNILHPHQKATASRIEKNQIVLSIQDTTYLNYTHHPKTEGLGPIGTNDSNLHGMLMHPTIAFTPDRIPLGIIHQQVWVRLQEPIDERDHKDKPIQDKESQKWLNSLNATEAIQKEVSDTLLINIGDREADIYELFQQASSNVSHLLVRAAWNRRVDHPQNHLWPCLESQPLSDTLQITVPRKKNQPERTAELELRFAHVSIKPPKRIKNASPITLQAVYVNEPSPPTGAEPVSWMLLTTLPLNSVEDAVKYVKYYAVRFSIELFFKVLKSGCKIEKRQLKTADAIKRCLAMDSIVAWRILFLTMLGRSLPNLPCNVIFEEHEWKSLYCFINKTTIPPSTPPSLEEATRWVARLGGFLNRKNDGYPGSQVLWRGLQNLHFITLSWNAFGPKLNSSSP